MTWDDARAQYPVLEQHAYLNAGTFGPLSRRTLDAMAELRRWEAERGRAGKAYHEAMLEGRERVRALLAGQIGARADELALTDSTTQAVHVVVTGLGIGAGDEVVTTDSEHFGLTGPLLAAGASLRIAPIREARLDDVFDVIRAHVSPRTRLLALSAVSWIDGRLIPWRELRAATGVPVLVDGAQSVGAVPVDVAGADFYTVSGQKWLCGPDATGGLYVRDPDRLRPRLVGYPSQAAYDVAAGTWEPKPGAARFDPGFHPAASVAGLEAALTGLPEGRFDRARRLTERCRELLAAAGHEVVTERGQARLVAFRAHGDAAETSARLYDRGVIVRDLPNTGLLRASVGWWNDESDLARLVDALDAL